MGSPGRFVAVGLGIIAVLVLAGVGAFSLIAKSLPTNGGGVVTATPIPVAAVTQAPAPTTTQTPVVTQVFVCPDGSKKTRSEDCILPQVAAAATTNTAVPVQQVTPSATPVQPTATPVPQPTATFTPVPVLQATATATPIPAPTIENINQVLATCNGSCPSGMQTQPKANQALLVHGDLTNSGTQCTYKVYRTGQTVPSSFGRGTFQVVLIQGPPEFVDASIKSDVAGAAGAAPTHTCPAG